MTPQARQLFLELCILRLRYRESEIEQLLRSDVLANDPQLKDLLLLLKETEASIPIERRPEKTPKKKGQARKSADDIREIRPAIAFFIERLESKKILQTDEQLANFARSIGVPPSVDSRELVSLIRESLEKMPAKQALQKMRSADRQLHSDSYVDLAKALMRS